VSSAAAVGTYDDLYGDRHARGLGGHARALREGRVTTGMVKLVALVGAAAIGSTVEHRQAADAALGTVLVAGGANLVNLFDLRPGRAAKVSLLTAAALSAGGDGQGRAIAAVAAGAALAALPADLGEWAMLGDCGAGTLGALLGWSAGLGGSRVRRGLLAAAVVALTVASERVSFSAVIERQPALRALDRLGRQPE
jgi:UDP-GlcNAc:undecaprenyl-phosphate GlcNAc-1-phosphate transferase